jgi:hypothetical protein
MRLLKSLYGYCMSGKLFLEEQAIVLNNFGLKPCDAAPALWYRHYPNEDVLMVLQYSDDLLYAATKQSIIEDFLRALTARFEHEPNDQADWYLQARISQDAEGNLLLDQHRYSRAIKQRYLPNMPLEPSKIVLNKYRDPLPIDFTWTSADNSKSHVEMRLLEVEFGFKFRAVTGSFNFLVNTSTRVMFAVRKCCKFMYMPGRPHFKAIKHLLYHIWCYPPGALKFYCDMTKSPLK